MTEQMQDPGTAAWGRRTVVHGDIELAVFETGDPGGPTVVMVHGWPDTHHLFNGVAAILADDHHVVAYDTRGQGETTDPGSVERFALPELAEDLFAVVDAVSPERPVHLLGHDWGSIQCWEAVCEPGAERRIASFTSISGPNLDHLAHWMRGSLTRPRPRRLAAAVRQAVSFSYVGFFVSPAGRPFFDKLVTRERWQQFVRGAEGTGFPDDRHGPTLTRDLASGLRYYRANAVPNLRGPRDRRTSVPVLQLVPTKDPAVKPASYADTPLWVDHVERVDVPYGHWVPLSHPDVVAAEVGRFIASDAVGTTRLE